MDLVYFNELLSYRYEKEWLEFKENWYDREEIGEYISALANAAALCCVPYAYMIWGVNDKSHKVLGTTFDENKEEKGEALKHFISRNLNPSISYKFSEEIFMGKRVIILEIPASKLVPTEFKKERYIRIGSSKENLRKYPLVEASLWEKLRRIEDSILNHEAPRQDLTFNKLLFYYMSKDLPLKEKTFKEDLFFYVPNTKKYNLLAYLMADINTITMRVSVFEGKTKADNLYSVREFGNQCMLYTIDKVLEYCDVINVIQADERNRIVERKEVALFDIKALREAVLNAFIHNDWLDLNAPMISVFNDRIDILSYGTIPNGQTIEGFYDGKSKPRCRELSDIFLQLRISERSGRGVNKIVDAYGKDAFYFGSDYIKVSIKYNRVVAHKTSKSEQESEQKVNKSQLNMNRIVSEMRNNPNITTMELIIIIGLKKTSIQKYIRILENDGIIKHMGSNKNGYWEVLK